MGNRIVLASDHRGYELKRALCRQLEAEGFSVRDLGTDAAESVDYPDFAAPAARAVSDGEASRAIVICGSGLGVAYTANRFPRVRAALVHDVENAALAREHNDANVLALSGDRTSPETDATLFTQYAMQPELARLINSILFPGNPIPGIEDNRSDLEGIFIPDLIKVDLSTDAVRLAGGVKS